MRSRTEQMNSPKHPQRHPQLMFRLHLGARQTILAPALFRVLRPRPVAWRVRPVQPQKPWRSISAAPIDGGADWPCAGLTGRWRPAVSGAIASTDPAQALHRQAALRSSSTQAMRRPQLFNARVTRVQTAGLKGRARIRDVFLCPRHDGVIVEGAGQPGRDHRATATSAQPWLCRIWSIVRPFLVARLDRVASFAHFCRHAEVALRPSEQSRGEGFFVSPLPCVTSALLESVPAPGLKSVTAPVLGVLPYLHGLLCVPKMRPAYQGSQTAPS